MNNYSQILQLRDVLIEALGRSVKIWGLNENLGRIYGLLYFAEEPLSLDEMAKALMVSKATISINVRMVEALKCVKKVWQKGSRKDYYVAERDFDKILHEILRTKLSQMETSKTALSQALEGYKEIIKSNKIDEVEELAKTDIQKINDLSSRIDVLEKWANFFLENDIYEGESEEIERIEVEWECDE